MMGAILAIVFLIFAGAIIAGAVSGINKSSKKKGTVKSTPSHTTMSTAPVHSTQQKQDTNVIEIDESMDAETKALIREVADYVGHYPITHDDLSKHTAYTMSKDFAAMPEWNAWGESIHFESDQISRIYRATQNISVFAYDAKSQLAKVYGSTHNVYLTSAKQCSCQDFKKRQLPCKHMYALCMRLDGDVTKSIYDLDNKPLYGLEIALAGRFSGGVDDSQNIRTLLNRRGGHWNENITEKTSILVCGKSPSETKILTAKSEGIVIMTQEEVLSIFEPENVSTS